MADPTLEEFERLLDENELVVVDFYATWCGPCKGYSPKFERAAREMRRLHKDKRVAFVKIDIDLQQDLARSARVMSVPTTVAFTRSKTLFGKPARKELIRFAGDRAWADLLRTMDDVIRTHAKPSA